jgi:hypothetical protein
MITYIKNRPWTYFGLVAIGTVLIGLEAGSMLTGYVAVAVVLHTIKLLGDLIP